MKKFSWLELYPSPGELWKQRKAEKLFSINQIYHPNVVHGPELESKPGNSLIKDVSSWLSTHDFTKIMSENILASRKHIWEYFGMREE